MAANFTNPPGASIGILGAMQSEVMGLVEAMRVEETGTTAGIQYWTGELSGRRVVVARCGMGKVSAAMGVQHLIDAWGVSCVVVCGLAGGLAAGLRVGDIVVGETFVQHDLDASPIFPRFQVPGLGIERFEATPGLITAAEASARAVAVELGTASPTLESVGSATAAVHRGLIVTGDQFIKGEQRHAILNDFPDALCVEMEGGAIAQVCYLNAVPFVIVRVVSDTADGEAPTDFLRFVEELAPAYTVSIVRHLIASLP
jgi:adenosylhomocysteine nucleosidase